MPNTPGVMVYLPDKSTKLALLRRAKSQGRPVSNFLLQLVVDDLRAAGLLSPSKEASKTEAELQAAIHKEGHEFFLNLYKANRLKTPRRLPVRR